MASLDNGCIIEGLVENPRGHVYIGEQFELKILPDGTRGHNDSENKRQIWYKLTLDELQSSSVSHVPRNVAELMNQHLALLRKQGKQIKVLLESQPIGEGRLFLPRNFNDSYHIEFPIGKWTQGDADMERLVLQEEPEILPRRSNPSVIHESSEPPPTELITCRPVTELWHTSEQGSRHLLDLNFPPPSCEESLLPQEGDPISDWMMQFGPWLIDQSLVREIQERHHSLNLDLPSGSTQQPLDKASSETRLNPSRSNSDLLSVLEHSKIEDCRETVFSDANASVQGKSVDGPDRESLQGFDFSLSLDVDNLETPLNQNEPDEGESMYDSSVSQTSEEDSDSDYEPELRQIYCDESESDQERSVGQKKSQKSDAPPPGSEAAVIQEHRNHEPPSEPMDMDDQLLASEQAVNEASHDEPMPSRSDSNTVTWQSKRRRRARSSKASTSRLAARLEWITKGTRRHRRRKFPPFKNYDADWSQGEIRWNFRFRPRPSRSGRHTRSISFRIRQH